MKKLVAYQKIKLAPQASQTVQFTLHKTDLSFINKALKRVTENGEFELLIQNQKQSLYVH